MTALHPNAPRISIAMCTYNGARFLPDQLSSIASQRVVPDELVVCDDRSTDGTVAVVEEFARRQQRFPVRLVVNARNLGSTKNFEQAIALCRGELIFLADQDDVWHAAKIQRIREVFASAPEVGLVFTDAEIVDEELRPAGYGLWHAIRFTQRERKAIQSTHAPRVLLKHNVVTGATAAFRRTFLELVTPIPASWIHDGWIALLISAVARVGCVDERLILYRQHSRNQVGARRGDLFDQIAAAQHVRRDAYLNVVHQYGVALERLSRLPPTEELRDLMSRVAAKMRHQERRGRMPMNGVLRASWILRELIVGNYHRYAGGCRSAVKDMVLL